MHVVCKFTFLNCIKMECVCLCITSFLHHFFQFICNFITAEPSVVPDTLINVTYANTNTWPLIHQYHLSALVVYFHPSVNVIFQRTLTLHCLTSSVLGLGPLPGNITWSYTVTLAVNRLSYLSSSWGQFAKSLTPIINFFYFTVGINYEQDQNFFTCHS